MVVVFEVGSIFLALMSFSRFHLSLGYRSKTITNVLKKRDFCCVVLNNDDNRLVVVER